MYRLINPVKAAMVNKTREKFAEPPLVKNLSWEYLTNVSTRPAPKNKAIGSHRCFILLDFFEGLYTARIIEVTAIKKPINIISVTDSLKYKIENRIGIMNDILLAKLVTVIPAFCEDSPIMKNTTINRIPIMSAMPSQFCSIRCLGEMDVSDKINPINPAVI